MKINADIQVPTTPYDFSGTDRTLSLFVEMKLDFVCHAYTLYE